MRKTKMTSLQIRRLTYAALQELIPDKQAFIDKMNALNLPGVRVEAERAVKCGITGFTFVFFRFIPLTEQGILIIVV